MLVYSTYTKNNSFDLDTYFTDLKTIITLRENKIGDDTIRQLFLVKSWKES